MSNMGSISALDVADAVAELCGADVSRCDEADLSRLVSVSLRVRGWLDELDARIALHAERVTAAAGVRGDATMVVGAGGRRSTRDVAAVVDRAGVCERMPELANALATGAVSAGHVDALAAATRRLDEPDRRRFGDVETQLVAAALVQTPEEFERHCRHLALRLGGDDGVAHHERLRRDRCVRRWVDTGSGMCKTLLALDPLADAQAWASINAAVASARADGRRDDDRSWDQLRADVVVDLLTGRADGAGRPAGRDRGPEVTVLIDHRSLVDGLHDTTRCETAEGRPIPVATVRRIACDADLVPIVLGGRSEVLDVGRQRRLATRAQRRALRVMHPTCVHPSCDVTFDACRIHHIAPWKSGGRTDLDNLVPLCERHHHLVHEAGWTIRLLPGRHAEWRTPAGRAYPEPVAGETKPVAPAASREVVTVGELATRLDHALDALAVRAPP
jgi:Domain of unknown function (DUF222)/HNH endonuclease